MKVDSLVKHESGQKRSSYVANVTSDTVEAVLKSQVQPDTHLMTDESAVYKRVGKAFSAHNTVNHFKKEYAHGNVTSNKIGRAHV